MNIFVINGGAGDGGGPSFVHLTDFRTAGSSVPGRLASFCHGYASWQPSHPLRPPWSMGRTVASTTWRAVCQRSVWQPTTCT
jgi:hypothetical protein